MATTKRVFTLRLSDEVFDKIGQLATNEHRSMTNYIEFVLLKHIEDIEAASGLFPYRRTNTVFVLVIVPSKRYIRIK